jgi:uncharacterized protein
MEQFNLENIRLTTLWASFAVGLLLGAVSHRYRFCTMGAVTDVLMLGSWQRVRMWLLAIGTASLGLQTLRLTGHAQVEHTIYLNTHWAWLSSILGGIIFGFGAVLTSGCGSKNLVRLGTGNLKALVVFIVTGISAYMTLKGILAVGRAKYLDPFRIELPWGADLPSMLTHTLHLSAHNTDALLSIAIPLLLTTLALSHKSAWNKDTIGGGLGVGLCVVAAWSITFCVSYIPEHPDTLEATYIASYTHKAEGLSFIAPYAYTLEWLMLYSDENRVLSIGILSSLGVMLGALLSSMCNKTFRWESFHSVEDTANHILGAFLMGAGGILALGCSIGQGLSGASTLAATSWITLACMALGAVIGLRYQTWRITEK